LNLPWSFGCSGKLGFGSKLGRSTHEALAPSHSPSIQAFLSSFLFLLHRCCAMAPKSSLRTEADLAVTSINSFSEVIASICAHGVSARRVDILVLPGTVWWLSVFS